MADADSHELTAGQTTPRPDPTELTDRAIARLEKSLTAYFDAQLAIRDERLSGIDRATELRLEQVSAGNSGLEDMIREAVAARAAVVDEKFRSIETQFSDRDTLAQRESQLNKIALDAAFSASKEAVAAALTAQKEAAAKQDEANAKAIDKSEKATAETIKANQELSRSTTDALTKSLDDVKTAVTGISATKIGGTESRTSMYALVGVIVTVGLALMALVSFVATGAP